VIKKVNKMSDDKHVLYFLRECGANHKITVKSDDGKYKRTLKAPGAWVLPDYITFPESVVKSGFSINVKVWTYHWHDLGTHHFDGDTVWEKEIYHDSNAPEIAYKFLFETTGTIWNPRCHWAPILSTGEKEQNANAITNIIKCVCTVLDLAF
jgi:hypothetical protein